MRLGELEGLLASLPRLGEEEAEALAEDVAASRAELDMRAPEDRWESCSTRGSSWKTGPAGCREPGRPGDRVHNSTIAPVRRARCSLCDSWCR
jgi:hypothetical protein